MKFSWWKLSKSLDHTYGIICWYINEYFIGTISYKQVDNKLIAIKLREDLLFDLGSLYPSQSNILNLSSMSLDQCNFTHSSHELLLDLFLHLIKASLETLSQTFKDQELAQCFLPSQVFIPVIYLIWYIMT